MPNLWINEEYVNRSKGWFFGETGPYETCHSTEERDKLFLSLQRQYGRCQGKMYVDRKDGSTLQIGWVFEKQTHYENTHEPYLQETWITVWSIPPQKVPEHWEGGKYAFA